MFRTRLYYLLKPLIPWSVRMGIRRWFARRKRARVSDAWPILPGSEKPPANWPGWPDGKKFAFVLTHDVEGLEGLAKVKQLAELEMSLGFRSSFGFIPAGKYRMPDDLRDWLVRHGFEVNVHDLHHDGSLYRNRAGFTCKATQINQYLKDWGAVGFRSGFMLRNLDWLHQLDVQYDASTFDTDPFEPQPDGTGTIFPFWVPCPDDRRRKTEDSARSSFSNPSSDSKPSSVLSPPSSDSNPSSALRPPRPVECAATPPGPSSDSNPSSVLSPLSSGYVELPYTLPQDSTLFLLLREKTPEIWLRKLDWIARHGGMALVNVHPDYVCFPGEAPSARTFPVEHYAALLHHVRSLSLPLAPDRAEGQGEGFLAHHPSSSAPTVPTRPTRPTNHPETSIKHPESALAASSQSSVVTGQLSVVNNPAVTSQLSPVLSSSGEGGSVLRPLSSVALAKEDPSSGLCWHPLPRELAAFTAQIKPSLPRQPRRICVLTYSQYRSDTRVLRYAEALAERGDHVDVVALRGTPDEPEHETNGTLNLFCLQTRFGRKERSRLSYFLPIARFLITSSFWIARQHIRKRYDLLHVHNVPDFLVFAALLPRLTGARVLLDIHDILPEFYGSKFSKPEHSLTVRLLKWIERASARFAHHVIVANHLWLDKYARRTGVAGKCSAFINNVDRRIFQPRPTSRARGMPIILFPGGLQWHQGLDIAIRAFQQIHREFPTAEFHIYGEGKMQESLEALARELALDGKVRFFKTVPVRQIAEVMAGADLAVVPKRADSFGNEAYSTKIMEFMSLGVPVVASSTRIDRYYFNDSVVKFFESGNPDSLAAAALEVLRDRSKREQMVARAREYAAQNSWESRKPDYLNLVDDLCSRR